jgi:hypothetical protein
MMNAMHHRKVNAIEVAGRLDDEDDASVLLDWLWVSRLFLPSSVA